MKTAQLQLLLGLGPEPDPTLANFVDGQNAELLHTLRGLDQLPADRRFIHLWGQPGCGRSHLLKAVTRARQGRYASLKDGGEVPQFTSSCNSYAIDDVDCASDQQASALFGLINQCREHAGFAVLTTACAPPAQLRLREDLRTRLGWGLVFLVERLNDADTEAALINHASQLGLSLSPEVRRYLMTHFVRDLRFLTHLVAELDRYALAAHRPVTLPLVRDFMRDQNAQGKPGESALGA
jgi:DnaA family protein